MITDFPYADLAVEQVETCNLCGSVSDYTVLSKSDAAGFPARAVLCNRCGLGWLNPRMSAETYATFYGDGTYRRIAESVSGGKKLDPLSLIESQRYYANDVAHILEPYLYLLPVGSTLLDIGGSTGVLAGRLSRQFSMAAVVLDPSASETSQARQFVQMVIQGSVESWEPGGWDPSRFSVVTLVQTVDHLLDIAGTFRKIRQWAKHYFVVDIVDFLANWQTHGRPVKIDHPFYLTRPTIEAYLARSGFVQVAVAVSPDQRHVFYVCRPCEPQPDALPNLEAVAMIRGVLGCS